MSIEAEVSVASLLEAVVTLALHCNGISIGSSGHCSLVTAAMRYIEVYDLGWYEESLGSRF